MSPDGWIIGALAVVVMVAAGVYIAGQRDAAQPAVLAAMTAPQRQRAMRQVRRGEPVAPEDLAGVRAVATEATSQRALGLVLALTGGLLALLVVLISLTALVEVLLLVAAAALTAAAMNSYYAAGRARLFLREHPDLQQAPR